MQARSVVFDLFGDHVRRHGGSIPLRQLTAVLECFGVAPDSARVVVSRLTREGWLQVSRDGRTSVYQPTDKLWELLDAGLERIMAPPVSEPWLGWWYMAIFSVPESERAARVRLRTKLSWLGFGQLGASTWLSAHDRLTEAEEAFGEETSARFDLFEARSRGLRSDRERAEQCWDLTGLARDYEAFTDRCRDLIDRAPSLSGPTALVTRTELVHDWRKFPFRDPGLPSELLPQHWPAPAAHAAFVQAFEVVRPAAEAAYQAVLDFSAPADWASTSPT